MLNPTQIDAKFEELTGGKDFSQEVLDAIKSILDGSMSNIYLELENFDDMPKLENRIRFDCSDVYVSLNLRILDCTDVMTLLQAFKIAQPKTRVILTEISGTIKAMGAEEIKALLNASTKDDIPALDFIRLSKRELGNEEVIIFSEALREVVRLPILRFIDFSRNLIGDEGAKAIAKAIAKVYLPALEVINLGCNRIKDEGAKAIGESIAEANLLALRSISLCKNRIGNKGAIWFSEAMAKVDLPALQIIGISNNLIKAKGVEAIGDALANLPALQKIHVSWNGIGDEGLQGFSEGLAKADLYALQEIDLESTQMGHKGANAIAVVLTKKKFLALKSIYLNRNNIGDAGTKDIGEAIAEAHLPVLQTISLCRNGIGDEGAKGFAEGLAKGYLPALQKIYVSLNRIGDEGAKGFAEGLAKGYLPALSCIDLSNNWIRDEGAKGFAEGLAKAYLPALAHIALDENHMGIEGIRIIIDIIAKNHHPTLKSIPLWSNYNGDERKKIIDSLELVLQLNKDRIDNAKQQAKDDYEESVWKKLPNNIKESLITGKHADLLAAEGKIQAAAGLFIHAISIMPHANLSQESESKSQENIEFDVAGFLIQCKTKLWQLINIDTPEMLHVYFKYYYKQGNIRVFDKLYLESRKLFLEPDSPAINTKHVLYDPNVSELILSMIPTYQSPNFYIDLCVRWANRGTKDDIKTELCGDSAAQEIDAL